MEPNQKANPKATRLPDTFVDRLASPFVRFLHIESAGGSILLLFTVAALVLSNSRWAGSFEHVWETQVGLQVGSIQLARPLREWINDGLMTLCPCSR
jgi:NhaA family Na+:H+ antiporter